MGGFEAVWPWCISQWQPPAEDQMNERESRSKEMMHYGQHGDLNEAKIQTVTEENILTFYQNCTKTVSHCERFIRLTNWWKMQFLPVTVNIFKWLHLEKSCISNQCKNWTIIRLMCVGSGLCCVQWVCPLVAADRIQTRWHHESCHFWWISPNCCF